MLVMEHIGTNEVKKKRRQETFGRMCKAPPPQQLASSPPHQCLANNPITTTPEQGNVCVLSPDHPSNIYYIPSFIHT